MWKVFTGAAVDLGGRGDGQGTDLAGEEEDWAGWRRTSGIEVRPVEYREGLHQAASGSVAAVE
jgi:hypothetical protein